MFVQWISFAWNYVCILWRMFDALLAPPRQSCSKTDMFFSSSFLSVFVLCAICFIIIAHKKHTVERMACIQQQQQHQPKHTSYNWIIRVWFVCEQGEIRTYMPAPYSTSVLKFRANLSWIVCCDAYISISSNAKNTFKQIIYTFQVFLVFNSALFSFHMHFVRCLCAAMCLDSSNRVWR